VQDTKTQASSFAAGSEGGITDDFSSQNTSSGRSSQDQKTMSGSGSSFGTSGDK